MVFDRFKKALKLGKNSNSNPSTETDSEPIENEIPKEPVKTEGPNFTFLESLINSGEKNIKLDSDIILDDDEASEYEYGIEISSDDIVIDGNGHTIDARGKARIFRIASPVTIKNITLINGYCKDDGGAIYGWNSLNLINVHFTGNHSDDSGGAVGNREDLNIRDCLFENNSSNEYGGALLSTFDSDLNIDNCEFKNNHSQSKGGAIHNINKMTLTNSILKNNTSPIGGAINSISTEAEITDTQFSENHSEGRGCDFYQELGDIKFKNVSFSSFKRMSVHSEKYQSFDNVYHIEFDDCRFNSSAFDEFMEKLNNSRRNFTYLDKLLKYYDGEIILDSDIVLDESEISEFEKGIQIDVQGTVLNGNGHSIDARGKLRIFYVDQPFTLKNITLKNGYDRNSGGAIYNNNDLLLEEVTFIKNTSGNWGGAIADQSIINTGTKMISCNFYENEGVSGSCIFEPSGPLEVVNCRFERNTGYNGIIDTLYDDTEVVIKDSVFHENSLRNSGVIYNSSKTKIFNCIFSQNSALTGGAIENIKEITVIKSQFRENTSEEKGGAVYNRMGGNAMFKECIFEKNNGCEGASFYNDEGKIEIRDCEISNHASDVAVIYTNDYFESSDSTFKDNTTSSVMLNDEKSDLIIINGDIINNTTKYGAIHNRGRDSIITRASFKNNHAKQPDSSDIFNETEMTLNGIKIENEGKSIANKGKLYLKNLPENFKEHISCEGIIIPVGGILKEGFNFTYLDKLIHNSETNEITLSEDIILDVNEKDFYEGGIELDIDGLVIDGNGKTIDGDGNSRIFLITAKDITLKNINFKNGFVFKNYENKLNGGGIIHNNAYGEVTIENCNFENGVSENNGGAINNYGELTLNDVKFENNITRRLGGAIYTYKNSKTTISNAKFNNNVSEDSQGGAIYNRNELHITSAGFIGNVSEGDGGAIFNCRGKLDLIDTRFTDNISSTSGGAIKSHQESRITVIDNIFENNNAMNGGAINLYYCDSMTIRNSEFNKNQSTHRGGVIYNNSCKNIEIYESSFTDNKCPKDGGVIHCSSGTIKINDCVFDRNEADNGGAIYEIIGSIDITNSTIKNSTASKGGAIYNGNYLRLFNTSFENNKADDGAGIYNLRLRIGNNPFAPPKTESKITINNVTFRNNVSNNRGGALYNEDTGIIRGDGVTFDGNKANEGDNIWAENDDDINISSVNKVGGGLGGIFKR